MHKVALKDNIFIDLRKLFAWCEKKDVSSVCILVWFQIPVYNSIIMQIFQGQDCLSKVHPGHVNRERTHVLHQGSTVTSQKTQAEDLASIVSARSEDHQSDYRWPLPTDTAYQICKWGLCRVVPFLTKMQYGKNVQIHMHIHTYIYNVCIYVCVYTYLRVYM